MEEQLTNWQEEWLRARGKELRAKTRTLRPALCAPCSMLHALRHYFSDSPDIGSECIESCIDILVAPVNLFDVVYSAFPFS